MSTSAHTVFHPRAFRRTPHRCAIWSTRRRPRPWHALSFIFPGAPYVERLRHKIAISAALTGITAAVVGVIANLALYFAEHTMFARTFTWGWGPFSIQLPETGTISPIALVITVAALVMTFVLEWPMLRILGICAVLGVATVLL
ncbi:chromate transporter [Nonomuraea terrae]|uniref:chromate transporter n=1 Tax=Nonomuraea terrae TaxID=2530383 RepID=UPI00378C09CD